MMVRMAAATLFSKDANETSYPGAVPPPPGVTPNLENPTDQGHIVNIVGLAICVSFVSIFFFIRVFVKLRITRSILLEDVMCLLSWILILLYAATVFMMSRYGEGYHSWDLPLDEYQELLKWLYAGSVIYIFAAFFTKVTLLLLIARVFSIRRGVSRGIYLFILFLILAYTPIQILKIRICNPIRSYWDKSVPGHCLNQRKIFLFDISLAILSDFVILLVPIPLTWRLHASWGRKLKIMLLLGAGGIATGATIFRMVKSVEFMNSKDVAADFVALDMLTLAELTIGLICSCLPSANLLIERRWRPGASPNSPRTRAGGAAWTRLTWNGLGTANVSDGEQPDQTSSKTSTKASTPNGPSVPSQPFGAATIKRQDPVNLDTELAMYPSAQRPPE